MVGAGTPSRGGPFYHGARPGKPGRGVGVTSRPGSGVVIPPQGGGGEDVYGAYRVFVSHWETATGSSDDALRDTDMDRPWTLNPAPAQSGLFVMSTSGEGRDYPTTNFLQSRTRTTSSGTDGHQLAFHPSDGYIPLCGVGDAVIARWYYRYMADASTDPNLTNHPSYFADDTRGSNNTNSGNSVNYGRGFPFDDGDDEPTKFQLSFRTWGVPSPGGDNFNTWQQLSGGEPFRYSRDTTYRIETKYHKTASDQYIARIVVYDVSGNVVSGEDTWRAWAGGQSSENLVGHTFDDNDDAQAEQQRGFVLGSEAADDSGSVGRLLHEFAGMVMYQGPVASLPWPVGEATPTELVTP